VLLLAKGGLNLPITLRNLAGAKKKIGCNVGFVTDHGAVKNIS